MFNAGTVGHIASVGLPMPQVVAAFAVAVDCKKSP